jgi:hypothetical protein
MGFALSPPPPFRRLQALVASIALAFGTSLAPGWTTAPVAANDCYGVSFATADVVSTNEDTKGFFNVLSNDLCIDGVTGMTVSIVSGPSHGSASWVSVASGTIVYTPNANYNGPDSLVYKFWSNEYPYADASAGTVSITVNPVNDPPFLGFQSSDCLPSISITVAEDSGPYAHNCSFLLNPGGQGTEDSQTVSLIYTGYDPKLFSVAPHYEMHYPKPNILKFTPAPNANGSTTVELYAKDNGGTANGGIDTDPFHYYISITITAVDDAPVAKADSYLVKPGVTKTVPAPGVLANDSDVDGPSLSAHVASLPSHGILSLLANGSFSYTPNSGFSGADSFTYTASDGTLSSAATKVSLTVSATATAAPSLPATGSEAPSSPVEPGSTEAVGTPASEQPGAVTAEPTAATPSTDAPAGSPAGSTGASEGTDLTPIVIAIVVAGLLVGLGLLGGALLLRRRSGPPAP